VTIQKKKKEKTDEELGQLMFHDIPTDLKSKFKSKCAERNISMKDAIQKLMYDFCK